MPMQASKILLIIFPIYGVKSISQCSVGDILSERKLFQFTATPGLMPKLMVDKVWHSNGL
jgi:hypothetical protein